MNTCLKAAIDFIAVKAGPHFSISPNSIEETDDFYCFTYAPTEYLNRSGSLEPIEIVGGFNILNKADNRIFRYSGSFSYQNGMADLSERLKKETEIKRHLPIFSLNHSYCLTIISNYSAEKVANVLIKYKATFIIPEIVGDSIFRIPTLYKKEQLMKRLSTMPATFNCLQVDCDLLLELLAIRGCNFEIVLKQHKQAAKYTNQATTSDLEPIW